MPLVQIDRKVDGMRGDFVGIDDAAAMKLILTHLVERGVRRVVLASSDDTNSAGRGRRLSFEHGVAEYGLEADPHIVESFSVEAGWHAADEIMARSRLPDAIVAGSDLNAIGLIARLRQHGVTVPTDILVTGYDGTHLSEIYHPSITTVQHPVRAVARNAVSFLLSRVTDPSEPSRESYLGATLVVRDSTLR